MAPSAFTWLRRGLTETVTPQGRLRQNLHRLEAGPFGAVDIRGPHDLVKDWIHFEPSSQHLHKKREIFQSPHLRDQHLLQAAGSSGPQREVLELLLEHLPQHYPQHFRVTSDGSQSFGPETRVAVQVFATLAHDRPMWRSNWNISWSNGLLADYSRYPHRNPGISEDERAALFKDMKDRIEQRGLGHSAWLKVEYQTLRRLRKYSSCVLFTVRTFLNSLEELPGEPLAAKALLQNLDRLQPTEFRKYLGIDDDYLFQRGPFSVALAMPTPQMDPKLPELDQLHISTRFLVELLDTKFAKQEAVLRQLVEDQVSSPVSLQHLNGSRRSETEVDHEPLPNSLKEPVLEVCDLDFPEEALTQAEEIPDRSQTTSRAAARTVKLGVNVMSERFEPEPPWKSFVKGPLDGYMGIVVLVNLAFMVLETQSTAGAADLALGLTTDAGRSINEDFFQIAEYIFFTMYAIDVVVRIIVLRHEWYYDPRQGFMFLNVFDACVVAVNAFELLILPLLVLGNGQDQVNSIRVIKLVRIARTLRIVKTVLLELNFFQLPRSPWTRKSSARPCMGFPGHCCDSGSCLGPSPAIFVGPRTSYDVGRLATYFAGVPCALQSDDLWLRPGPALSPVATLGGHLHREHRGIVLVHGFADGRSKLIGADRG
eukprot:Skav215351  [mRNA]  locus=scaffold1391:432493:439235:- [translate_table: standard]